MKAFSWLLKITIHFQKKSIFYAKECLEASDTLAEDILKKIKYSGIIATDF